MLTADSEGYQAGVGAGGDVHRLGGRHGRGEVRALLRPVHALPQAHCGECRAEGAAAAPWENHRVHQSHWPGRRKGEGGQVTSL